MVFEGEVHDSVDLIFAAVGGGYLFDGREEVESALLFCEIEGQFHEVELSDLKGSPVKTIRSIFIKSNSMSVIK